MGECGCISSGKPLGRLAGPDGVSYVLVSFPGCAYCSAPSGLDVVKVWGDDAEFFDHAPEMEWLDYGSTSSIASFPIFSEEEIRKPLQGRLLARVPGR